MRAGFNTPDLSEIAMFRFIKIASPNRVPVRQITLANLVKYSEIPPHLGSGYGFARSTFHAPTLFVPPNQNVYQSSAYSDATPMKRNLLLLRHEITWVGCKL